MKPLETRGVWGGSYSVRWSDSSPQQQWGMVFAGQGGAHAGMFAEDWVRPELRQRFELADALCRDLGLPPVSEPIRNLGWQGEVAQMNLALFTLEVGLFEAMGNRGFAAHSMTAHSFGEYAALVAAGVVAFEDLFPLVAHRERISPPPNQRGYLIAVEGDRESTQLWLKGLDHHIANTNSPNQTVVAVTPEFRDRVVERVKGLEKRVTVIATPQPYHSPLLGDLPVQMEAALQGAMPRLHPPSVPLFSSVTQSWIGQDIEQEFRAIIRDQLTAPVLFIDQIRALKARGCERFVEIGPRVLLRPLIEANYGDRAEVVFAGDRLAPRAKRVAPKSVRSNPVLKLVNKVIGRITGYEIEAISLEDRFQEDLGIDSIKKTELLFTVLDELKVPVPGDLGLDRFQSVSQLVDFVEGSRGKPTDIPTSAPAEFARFAPVWSPQPLKGNRRASGPSPLVIPLRTRDFSAPIQPEELAQRFLDTLGELGTRTVVLLLPSFSDWQEWGLGGVEAWLRCGQRLASSDQFPDSWSVVLVTQGERDPINEAMGAFLKSLARESEAGFVKRIHFDEATPDKKVLDAVHRELGDPTQPEVRYSKRGRLTPQFRELESRPTSLTGVVVALGGAKGITLELLRQLHRPDVQLWVAGRTKEAEVREALGNLSPVQYREVDTTDREAVDGLFREVTERHGEIDLVINGVGMERSRSLANKSDEEITAEWRTKVHSNTFLLEAGKKYGAKRHLTFSSIVSHFGNPGQTVYAAANAWIEAQTEWAGAGTSCIWPPWDNVGMTRNPAILKGLRAQGLGLLSAQRGGELFPADLSPHGESRVLYWDPADRWSYEWPGKDHRSFGWLGRNAGLRGGLRLTRTLSIEHDPYLEDHRVGGTCYLPAAVGLVQFLAATWLATGKWHRLRNFEVLQPIIVPRPQELTLRLEHEEGGWNARLEGEMGGRFQALLDTQGTRDPHWMFAAPQKFDSEPIYGNAGLFHGATFHLVREVFFDGDGAVGSHLVEAFPVPILDGREFGRLALALDAAFQTLAIGEMRSHGVGALPVGVEEWTLSPQEDWRGPLQIRVENRKAHGEGEVTADVSLWNGQEQPLFSLRGVRLRRAEGLAHPVSQVG